MPSTTIISQGEVITLYAEANRLGDIFAAASQLLNQHARLIAGIVASGETVPEADVAAYRAAVEEAFNAGKAWETALDTAKAAANLAGVTQ